MGASVLKEAMFYEKLEDELVNCDLCSHRCRKIADSKKGICGVRENMDGKLYSLVYGKAVARSIDPIEKKPLFNFLPGSRSYSIATVGCNFRCDNCQNYDISQMPKERGIIVGHDVSPKEIVSAAKVNNFKNVFVTNGYITSEALKKISPYLDAANIDLKSFKDNFYRKRCGARLKPVLDSIRLYKSLGIWIEITTLIIPTLNDSEEELRKIAEFISEVGEDTPWHISQFYPTYKLITLPRTPVATLRKASKIGLEAGLKYVYEGNVPGENGENTYCPNCEKLLIHRFGYQIRENKIKNSTCTFCGAKIDGLYT